VKPASGVPGRLSLSLSRKSVEYTSRVQGTERKLLSCKTVAVPGGILACSSRSMGPARLNSAPGDLLSLMESYHESLKPAKREELASTVGADLSVDNNDGAVSASGVHHHSALSDCVTTTLAHFIWS
jgi:hypothetical protein